MRSLVSPGSQGEQAGRLFLAGLVVLLLPSLPFGNFIAYPFVILTTWFHEMGHGLTTMLLGHGFERLVIFPSGSGFAESSIAIDASPFERAAIAAGGPLAPSLFGAALIYASSRPGWWRAAFYGLAGLIAISALIWVRSLVGLIALPFVAVLLVMIAQMGKPGFQRFSLQFLGLLAALSMFRDWDYLFSETAIINGQVMLSDTGAIEQNLFLPHWFWAAAIIGISGLIVGWSLKIALKAGARPLTGWRPR